MSRILFVWVLFVATGCVSTHHNREHYQVASAPVATASAVVIVVNGSGDVRAASENLFEVAVKSAAPFRVETFVWSRGSKRYIADQVDRDNHRWQARRLADLISAYRQADPNRRICLVGQSAGSEVVLSAAEALPPSSIDRIILLSPSVCACRDLRPALQASREGIDHFYSNRDRFILGLGMRIVGTTEGDCRTAAGRVGFNPILGNPADAALYANLRQYPWDPSMRRLGHDGGHFGNHQPAFLRTYVLPLLCGPSKS